LPDAQADAPETWDIMVNMDTWLGASDPVPFKEGTHVFTPKSNYKPRLFRAPIAHLMCWLLRAETFATLRCWEDKVPESELNGPNFVTTHVRATCDA
jgi:hypothetical protein